MTREQKIKFIEARRPDIEFITDHHPSCNRLIIDVIIVDGEVMKFNRNLEAQKPAKEMVDRMFDEILNGGNK